MLVVFGGNDEHQLTSWAMGQLRGLKTCGVDGSVAEAMMAADVLVTSAGRTVNEAAAVGLPAVVVAANHRESAHVHVEGVIYGGLHVAVADGWLATVVKGLLSRPELRAEIGARMRAQVDGRGSARIAHRVDGLLESLS